MSKKSARLPFGKLLVLALIVGGVWGGYRALSLQPAEIFLLTGQELTYGDTILTGTIHKDSSLGEAGNYYLVTPGGSAIMLDVTDLDTMLGLEVTASGYLTPAASSSSLPFMVVSNLETN